MKTTTLGLCALLFFSCTQEDFPGQAEGGTPCDYICFGLSPDGVAQTKGGARTDADGYVDFSYAPYNESRYAKAGEVVFEIADLSNSLFVEVHATLTFSIVLQSPEGEK